MLNRIAGHLSLTSERPALYANGYWLTYGELAARVATIQAGIEAMNPDPGSIIAIAASADDPETYAAILAVLHAGHGYLPINPAAPAERNAAVLLQSGARLMITKDVDSAAALVCGAHTELLVTSRLMPSRHPPEMRVVSGSTCAYLLFTSGSTGVPKGVPITRANLDAFLHGLFAAGLDLSEDDRVLQMFDLTFDFSVMSCFASWVAGACIFAISTQEPRFMSVYRLLDEFGITCAPMVPSALTFLRPYFDEIRLDSLRHSVFCGEPLLDGIASEWSRCAAESRIFNFYGPTEATVFCSFYEWTPARRKAHHGTVSIGRPMLHCRMAVVDDDDRVLGAGKLGQICLAGEQLTTGYFNDPVRNLESFFELMVDGKTVRYYRTGDLGLVDEEGDFMFMGRVDQQVKVNGFRIELGEIEYHSRRVDGVGQAIAVLTNAPGGTAEIALCLENFGGDAEHVELELKRQLPAYMVPSRILKISSFPLNRNGKIDRTKLRQQVVQMLDGLHAAGD